MRVVFGSSYWVILILFLIFSPLGDTIRFIAENNDSFYNKDPYEKVYEERFLNPETFAGDNGYKILKQDLIDGFNYILEQRNPTLETAGFPIWTTIQSLQNVSQNSAEEIRDEIFKNFGIILTEQHRILSGIRNLLYSGGWSFIDIDLAKKLENAAIDTVTWLWEVWSEQALEFFGLEYASVSFENKTFSDFKDNEMRLEKANLSGFYLISIYYKEPSMHEITQNQIKAVWTNGSWGMLTRNLISPNNLLDDQFYIDKMKGRLILGCDTTQLLQLSFGYNYSIPFKLPCLPNKYKSTEIFDIDENDNWLTLIQDLAAKYKNNKLSINIEDEQVQVMLFRIWADRLDKFVDILGWTMDITSNKESKNEQELWNDRKNQIEIVRALNWCYFYQEQYGFSNITYNTTEFWNKENISPSWDSIEWQFNDSLYQAISAMYFLDYNSYNYNEDLFKTRVEAKQAENMWNKWFLKLSKLAFFKNLNDAESSLSTILINGKTFNTTIFTSGLRSLIYLFYLTPLNETFPLSPNTYELYKRMWTHSSLEEYDISEYISSYNYNASLPSLLHSYRSFFEILDPQQNKTEEFGSVELKKRLEESYGALRLKNHQKIKEDIGLALDSSSNSLTQVLRYRESYYIPLLVYYFAYLVIGDIDPNKETNTAYDWLKTAIQIGNYISYSPDASMGMGVKGEFNKTFTTAGNYFLTYLPTWDEFSAIPNNLPDQHYYNYSLFNATPQDTEKRYYRSYPAQGAIHYTIGVFAYDLWNWIKYYSANDFPVGAWEEIELNYAHMQKNLRIAVAQIHATQINENWSEILEDGSFKDYEYLMIEDMGGWLSGTRDYVICRDLNDSKEVWEESSHPTEFTEKAGIFATLNALESVMYCMEYIIDRPVADEEPFWRMFWLGVIFIGVIGVIVYVYKGRIKFNE